MTRFLMNKTIRFCMVFLILTFGAPLAYSKAPKNKEDDKTERELRLFSDKIRPCLKKRDRACLGRHLVDDPSFERGFGCSEKKDFTKSDALDCILYSETKYSNSIAEKTLFEVLTDCYGPESEIFNFAFRTKNAYHCDHEKVKGEWKLEAVFMTD